MIARAALPAIVVLVLLTGFAPAGDLTGRIVGITDGDTVRLLTSSHELLRVRLTEIDAPEHDQPFGAKSKRMLSDLIFEHQVRVVSSGEDRYGRTLGRIYDGSLDVSAEMVREGGAWAFRRYLTDRHILLLEQEARGARRGLWALQPDQIMPPWEWRRLQRQQRSY